MKSLLLIGLLICSCVSFAMKNQKDDDVYLFEPILPSPSDFGQKGSSRGFPKPKKEIDEKKWASVKQAVKKELKKRLDDEESSKLFEGEDSGRGIIKNLDLVVHCGHVNCTPCGGAGCAN